MVLHELVLHDRVVNHLWVIRDRTDELLMDRVVPRSAGQRDDANQLGKDKDRWVLSVGALPLVCCLDRARLLHEAFCLAGREVLEDLDVDPRGSTTGIDVDGPRPGVAWTGDAPACGL